MERWPVATKRTDCPSRHSRTSECHPSTRREDSESGARSKENRIAPGMLASQPNRWSSRLSCAVARLKQSRLARVNTGWMCGKLAGLVGRLLAIIGTSERDARFLREFAPQH